MKIASIGTARIKMFDGTVRVLVDVRHVLQEKTYLVEYSCFKMVQVHCWRYSPEGYQMCPHCDEKTEKVCQLMSPRVLWSQVM